MLLQPCRYLVPHHNVWVQLRGIQWRVTSWVVASLDQKVLNE
jgi:hypothetical protein